MDGTSGWISRFCASKERKDLGGKQSCSARFLGKSDCGSVLPYFIVVVWKMRWTGRCIFFYCFLLRTFISCSVLAGFRIEKMEWRIIGRSRKESDFHCWYQCTPSFSNPLIAQTSWLSQLYFCFLFGKSHSDSSW